MTDKKIKKNKKITKEVGFLVTYNPDIIEKTGKFMSQMDLGITKIEWLRERTVTWRTTTKVDAKYINKMRKAVKKAFESQGDRVISVKKLK